MGRTASPYYPPRAHWYAPLIYIGGRLRRRLYSERIHLPTGLPWPGLLASLFVPGLGVYVRGPRIWGLAALAASGLLLLTFVAELGRPAGNIAFGLLISIHATGLNYLLAPWLAATRFRFRLLLTMGLLVGLGTLLYLPAQNFVDARFVTPLRIHNRVVVVGKVGTHPRLHRGQWVAYSLPESGDHNGYVQAGLGLGPILAVGGDQIRFTSAAFEVNGRPQPRLEHMPDSGELVVPGNSWFIWPNFAIAGHGNVPESTLAQTMLSMATIAESQIVGKPLKWWFWHRQFPL